MPKKIKQEQIEKMVEMYEQGYSMAEIARLLNLSRNTVSKYLKGEGREPIMLKSEMEGAEKEEDVGVSSIEPIGLLPFDLQKRIWLTSDEYGVPLEDVADRVLGLVRFCTYEQMEFSDLLNVIDFLQEHRKTIRSEGLSVKDFASRVKGLKELEEEERRLRKEVYELKQQKERQGQEQLNWLFEMWRTKKLGEMFGEIRAKQSKEQEKSLLDDANFMQDLLYSSLLQQQPTRNPTTNVDLTELGKAFEEMLKEQLKEKKREEKKIY